MDNPQPYQPLSQALQSLAATTNRHYQTTGHHALFAQHEVADPQNHIQSQNVRPPAEEEEEEEEEENDDEGLVEEQLNHGETEMHVSRPTSPKGSMYVGKNGRQNF